MSNLRDAKKVFRRIDDALIRLQVAPKGESARIAESLRVINMELCDKFIEIYNKYESFIAANGEDRQR